MLTCPHCNQPLTPNLPRNITGAEEVLLQTLISAKGRTVSMSTLIENLWPRGEPASSENMVHIFIHRLRKKLGKQAVVNVRGAGWRLGELP